MSALTTHDLDATAAQARGRVVAALRHARGRSLGAGAVLAFLAFLAFCASVSVGDYPIPLLDVVPALLGSGDEAQTIVARDLRLPRALAAVACGVGFGLAGAIFQAVARNPLASPDVLGIIYGGSAASVFVITELGSSYGLVAGGAFAGCIAMTAAIYLLAFRHGGVSPYRFVLIGIALGSVGTAIVQYLLTRAEIEEATLATVWLTGSLDSVGWEAARPTAIAVLVLGLVALACASRLRALQLGDETARAIGVPVERSRLALLLVAVALAAAGTAACGPIAFVAFMAAPIARRLTRSPMTLLPAALVGALLVLVADLVGRRAFGDTEVPVGVITGIVGAPYLLWLLARANRIGVGG